MKILVVVRAMDNMAGGVERMAVELMNNMVGRGHTVECFSWDTAGARSFYPIHEDVKWHCLDMGDPGQKAGIKLMIARAFKIRSLFGNISPDIVICFQAGPFISMKLYTFGLGIPFIAAERNSPSRFEHTSAGKHKMRIYACLALAQKITIQCESYRQYYPGFLRNRIMTISNPVKEVIERAKPDSRNGNNRYRLLSVGRLSYQKNYIPLILAFAELSKEFSDWDLEIIGSGEARNELENKIAELNLDDRIFLPGTTSDINACYRQAHIFCLPSRWEGFPNALAEAMAHGLPVAGYSGCDGVQTLIDDSCNGLLASGNGDAGSLATCLKSLMSSSAMRKEMGDKALESVKKYKPETIFNQWETLFLSIRKNKRASS